MKKSDYITIGLMMLFTIYSLIFVMLPVLFGGYYYLVAIFIGIWMWLIVNKKIKAADPVMMYMLALLFASSLITVTNLTFDELNIWIRDLSLEQYINIKLFSNFLGWAIMPIGIAKLTSLAKK